MEWSTPPERRKAVASNLKGEKREGNRTAVKEVAGGSLGTPRTRQISRRNCKHWKRDRPLRELALAKRGQDRPDYHGKKKQRQGQGKKERTPSGSGKKKAGQLSWKGTAAFC